MRKTKQETSDHGQQASSAGRRPKDRLHHGGRRAGAERSQLSLHQPGRPDSGSGRNLPRAHLQQASSGTTIARASKRWFISPPPRWRSPRFTFRDQMSSTEPPSPSQRLIARSSLRLSLSRAPAPPPFSSM